MFNFGVLGMGFPFFIQIRFRILNLILGQIREYGFGFQIFIRVLDFVKSVLETDLGRVLAGHDSALS